MSPIRSLLLWLVLSCLEASQLSIKTFTTADGLARDRIQCITQDRLGFLWFCTPEGLSRFDGYRFTNYGTEQGLPSNNVSDLLETADGIYWVGTPKGPCRFDTAAAGTAKVQCYALPGNSQAVIVLRQDRKGRIWCGAHSGLFRLAKDGASFQREDLGRTPEEGTVSVHALLEDRRGGFWVGTGTGLYLREPDGRTISYCHIFGNKPGVLSLLEDREGRLWIGATDSLWRIDPSSAPRKCLSNNRIFSLLQSSDGKVWIGTSRGLAEWRPRTRDAEGEFEFYGLANGLAARQIGPLIEDRDRNLWIGTDGGGIMRMAPSGFITYSHEDGLLVGQGTDAGSIFETRAGELCFWQRSGGSRFDGKGFIPTHPQFPRSITNFGWGIDQLVLQDHTGDWWIATGQGLFRFPPVRFDRLASSSPKAVYRASDGLLGNNIFQIFEDSRGDIWISTVNSGKLDGVARWERRTGLIQAATKADGFFGESTVTGFAEDRAGNVWMGCYDGGLARYRNGRFTMFTDIRGVPAGGWKRLYVDSAGRLWVAAYQGLGRADNPTEDLPSFVTYTSAQGLASNEIQAITEDRWGRIYVATGRGLDRLEPQPGGIRATKHYTILDGLAAGELISAYRDRIGNLWFATNRGLLSQFTPTLDGPSAAPPVLITALQVGTVPYPIPGIGHSEVPGLKVKSGQGPLRIDFLGLNFAPGDQLRYQYLLEGLDSDWSAPSDQRTVVYGHLASGKYRFLVRAVNGEGIMSSNPSSVAFTMLPPLWLSWWFIAAAGLGTAALLYAAYCHRIRQLLAVERLRTRIATDLHDDIGSSLSQISILSELVRQRLNTGDPQVSQPLAEIATVAGEMVASLSDIVWAINPRHDRLRDLSARMQRFALDVLGARGIELRFQTDEQQEHLHTNSDFRRQVFLIFKEAINNAARHARCTRAAVELHVGNGHLELRMSDNGCGFEPVSAGNGNGLPNMRRRAADLGGQLDLRSEPGRGTELKLSVPLPDSRSP